MPLASFYCGILGFILIFLSIRISYLRRKFGIGLGDGDVKELRKAIRVHGNTAEFIPYAAILLLLVESQTLKMENYIHISASCLILGRILFAWGLTGSSGPSFGRFLGTALTWLTILFLSGLNIYLYLNN